MADKYTNQTGLTYLVSKLRAYIDAKVIAPLATKTYSNIYASANNFASAAFYFGTVRPTSWYKVWRVKYRIQATAGSDNNYAGSAIVEVYGCQANRLTYAIFNNHYNTSYRSFYYHNVYSLTAAGYTNGYGHALGIELTNSANPTSATYARTFTVEILETDNCDVTLLTNMTLYASLAGTGATNYNGYWQLDGQNNGLKEISIEEAEYNTVAALNNGNAYFDNYNELGVLDTSNIYVHWTTES